MSGYKSIPNSLIAVGKATTQLLWFRVRNNFRSHEQRISEIEDNTNALPPGFMLDFAGSVVPDGFLFCDGSAVSQSTYADLFAIIGLTYGNPGGGNFNLPDYRAKVCVGKGTGSGLTARSLADEGGAEDVTLLTVDLPVHNHAKTDPTHRHDNVGSTTVGTSTRQHNQLFGTTITPTRATNASSTGITIDNTGGGGSHNNIMPVASLNVIIKT